jgi:DNA-binding MarR family transcriptional regulator
MTSRKPDENATAEFVLALRSLIRRLRVEVPTEMNELSWTQKAVMARLEAQGPATTADLARAENMKPQSMGAAVAGLESMGFVKRKPHPTDGRQVHIELTPKGAAARKNAKDAKLTWLAHAIEKLDGRDQKTLFAAGRILKRLGEK